jgi:AraC-like DNA-binding protein
VTVSARYAGLDLKLTPLGAYRLLAMPLTELAGGTIALDDLLVEAGGLLDRIRTAPTWEERFDAVEALLLGRAGEGPEPAPFVEWAWRRIGETGGRLTVGELAGEIGCSRRHLQAKFTEQVGLSPKLAIRMTRFERVCQALHATPGRWADLAAEAGYADQAHLNRDFRDLAGTTPSDYLVRVAAADS